MTVDLSDEQKRKQQFARELLKSPQEGFKIAVRIFGDDTGRALEASHRWPHDPEVIGFMNMALEELGDLHFLPSKADAARAAWEISQDPRLAVDDRLKGLRLYSDIRGFIEKQGTVINNNVLTQNKVMMVRDHGTNEEWENAAAAQQAKLIADANAPRH